jgi:hypothetical protein
LPPVLLALMSVLVGSFSAALDNLPGVRCVPK